MKKGDKMVDYNIAIKRPFTDLKKFLLGVLFNIFPIANFVAMGYELEAGKKAMKKDFKLPEWEGNIWNYFVKGFFFVVIMLIYFLPILIILVAILGVNIINFIKIVSLGDESSVRNIFVGGNFIIGSAVVSVVLVILVGYIVPMAVLHYIVNWKFEDAFKLKSIFRKCFTKKYFVAWLILTLYFFIVSVVATVIPFLGRALSSFICGVTSYTILGEVYSEIK